MSLCQEGRPNGFLVPASLHQIPTPDTRLQDHSSPDQIPPPDPPPKPTGSSESKSGLAEIGKSTTSPAAKNNLSPKRKRVKRVSKEELESILAKRVKKELGENCDLVKLQKTCKELQGEVSRWKARTERLASECAKLEKLINSPAKIIGADSEKVKEDVRQAVISKKEFEEESLPLLPARVTPNDSLPTPLLTLTQTQLGLEVQWTYEGDQSFVASYELFAFRKLTLKSSSPPASNLSWKKVGDVKSIPLPMKCTLSQFKAGSTYSFAVRSKDAQGGIGQFSDVKIISLT